MKRKTVLFVYGGGGHKAQMVRLFDNIKVPEGFSIITASDDPCPPAWSSNHIVLKEVRDKNNANFFSTAMRLFFLTLFFFSIVVKNKSSVVVSTGPGIAVPAGLVLKIFPKRKFIYIETWSRFYSKSYTGKFMYFLSDYFYYQNKTLGSIYPSAKYSGRL